MTFDPTEEEHGERIELDLPDLPEPFRSAIETGRAAQVRNAPASSPLTHYARGLARALVGDRAEARFDFGTALPTLPDACNLELAALDVEDGLRVDEAAAKAQAIADRPRVATALRARALHVLGLAAHRLRDSDRAVLALADAISLYRTLVAHREQARVHDALGRVFGADGQLELALHHFSLGLLEKALSNDRAGSGMSLVHLGRVQLQAGRDREAVECLDRAVDLGRETDDTYVLACAANSLGEAQRNLGDLERAEAAQRTCLEACGQSRYPFVAVFAQLDLALILARRGKPEAGRCALAAARDLAEHSHLALLEAHSRQVEGEIALAEKDHDAAAAALTDSVRAFAAARLPDHEIPARISLAQALENQGRVAAAEQCLLAGVGRARNASMLRFLPVLNEALTRLGTVPSSIDEVPRAISEGPDPIPGSYVVRQRLGGGGFGEVYRAYDPIRSIEVAVKRLKVGHLYDHDRAERLLASVRLEIESASRVDHPGVARVYAVGRTPDGDAYVVQEFVRGSPLRNVIPVRPEADPVQVLRVLAKVCLALQALHASGVVHRDLKPENIILRTPVDPVLIDFGIAHADGFRKGMDDSIVGTLDYMAPEQARGKKVDGRADLYAVGVLTYEWLTGTLPLRLRGADFESRAEDLARRDPSPLSDFRPGLPDELAQLIAELLQKKPRRRPADAAEVASRLEALAATLT